MALIDKLTAIADGFRDSRGTTEPLTLDEMAVLAAEPISSGGGEEEWFNDGDTHIWIELPEGRTSPILGVCPSGTVTVDWGDGTEPDVLTGEYTSLVLWTPTHNYAKAGSYVITLKTDGKIGFNQYNEYSCLLRQTVENNTSNNVYQNAIVKIEIGNRVSYLGYNAFCRLYSLKSVFMHECLVTSIPSELFYQCYSLKTVVIPNGIKSISHRIFSQCYSLENVVIPSGAPVLGTAMFNQCYALKSVVIPDSVNTLNNNCFSQCGFTYVTMPSSLTTIYTGAFEYCYGVKCYDFSNCTQIPTISSPSVFTISSDCEIRVPSALYDEWITTDNWSTLASQIVAV